MNTELQAIGPLVLLRSSRALFAALGLLLLGNGLLVSLVGIRVELEGFNTTLTGIVLAFYFVGYMMGARLAPPRDAA